MDAVKLEKLLVDVKNGNVEIGKAVDCLQGWPSEVIDCAHLDHMRIVRTGVPEVIFGENKNAKQIVEIAKRMVKKNYVVMATRVERDKADFVCQEIDGFVYYEQARMLVANQDKIKKAKGRGDVVVLSAGTSDIPVAEEVSVTVTNLGHTVKKAYDVGVAGIHRLFSHRDMLESASVLVVVAGMEGALPSVVAGLVHQPVIAVPTSVGYGTGLGGIAAMLAMLNGCAPGVAVVNIDNGFGAGCMAAAINNV